MKTPRPINQQIFQFLEGEWRFDRRFEGSYCGVLNGAASFAPERGAGRAYSYIEQGKLTNGAGQHFDAKQTYRYRLCATGIEVLKREASDWMVMHQLDFELENGIATARHVHHCGQDHYAAVYRIDFAGNWELTYRVNGPRKDYRIHSVYRRQSLGR